VKKRKRIGYHNALYGLRLPTRLPFIKVPPPPKPLTHESLGIPDSNYGTGLTSPVLHSEENLGDDSMLGRDLPILFWTINS
jgi:hypothetical protein